MANQKYDLLATDWNKGYIIKRIGEDDIPITNEQRKSILGSLNDGVGFIQIGEYTLMLNGIKSIEPRWNGDSFPPRPKEEYRLIKTGETSAKKEIVNIEEILLWDNLFKNKLSK